jgi:hypothetical protein
MKVETQKTMEMPSILGNLQLEFIHYMWLLLATSCGNFITYNFSIIWQIL